MPTTVSVKPKYRLTFGHVSQSTILADSTAIIRNWSYATAGRPWRFATSESIITPYVERVQTGLNTEVMEGKPHFTATFGLLNSAQLYWLWSQASFNPTPLVTVVVRNRLLYYDESHWWGTVQCKMRFPELTPQGLGSIKHKWYRTESLIPESGQPLVFDFYDCVYNDYIVIS